MSRLRLILSAAVLLALYMGAFDGGLDAQAQRRLRNIGQYRFGI